MFTIACEAAAQIGLKIEGARVAVQGFGNVGGIAARLFAEAGALVVAVQDHTGGIARDKGLDVPRLLEHVAQDAVLDLVQAEMVFVENRLRIRQVMLDLGPG